MKCKQQPCENEAKTLGWCILHYHRHYYGRPMDVPKAPRKSDPYIRFISLAIINPETGCWIWNANRNHSGYGMFKFKGKSRVAHKWIYEFLNGEVKPPLQLDHLCMVKCCVNPSHLEPVTASENIRRAHRAYGTERKPKVKKENIIKTHCPYGHPYSGDNLRMIGPNHRQCITCHRKAVRQTYWRKKNAP